VRYDLRRTASLYQNLNITHKPVNSTTFPANYKGRNPSVDGDKKRLPLFRGSLVITNAAYLINGTMRRATMLMTLIIGLMAGPAVSL